MQFRVGDVVRVEELIERIGEDFIVTRCANGAGRSMCRRTVENGGLFVTLIRRPVILGDSLRHVNGRPFGPMTEENMHTYRVNGGAAEGWMHADGTEIDRPKVARTAELTGQQLAERNGAWTAAGEALEPSAMSAETIALMDAMLAKDPIAQVALRVRQHGPCTACGGAIELKWPMRDTRVDGSFCSKGCIDGAVSERMRIAALAVLMAGAGTPVQPEVDGATKYARVAMAERNVATIPCECGGYIKNRQGSAWHRIGCVNDRVARPVSPGYATAEDVAALLKPGESRIYNDGASVTLRADGPSTLKTRNGEMQITKDGLLWSTPADASDDRLAHDLFVTDPEVLAYVHSRSDAAMPPKTVSRWSTSLGRTETVRAPSALTFLWGPKIAKAMQIAWDIGKLSMAENATKAERATVEAIGYRRAVERAEAMKAVQR